MPSGVDTLIVNWDNVTTMTERAAMPKLVDNIFKSNPTIMRLWKKGTKLGGGDYIIQPLIYGEGPGGPFEGIEPLSTAEAEQFTAAVYHWKQYYASATIRRIDELRNSGKAKFMNLLKSKLTVMEKTMKNNLAIGLFSDGSNPLAITGLRAAISSGNVTYGGINRQTNPWWAAYVDSTSTTVSTAALRDMTGKLTEDGDTPNFIVTTQAIYDKLYLQQAPLARQASGEMAKAGFTSLVWEGREIVVDSHCPANHLFMLNLDYVDLVSHSDENMRFEGWVKPYNQQGRSAFILWAGNLVFSNSRFQGKFTALTS